MEAEDSETTVISSCVRGYHIYKDVWKPKVGDKLECCREPSNVKDRYAVAVVHVGSDVKDATVGHLLQKISCVCSLFIRRGGNITCEHRPSETVIRLATRRIRDPMLVDVARQEI